MLKKKFISSMQGKKLNSYTLHVGNISRGRFVEETNFNLYLKAIGGEISEIPGVKGKYFSRRGKFYKPWLEIYYYDRVKFRSSKSVDLSETELEEKLFKHLSDLLPPCAHIMVVYLNHEETRKGLEKSIPAPATPIGYLLWKSGCTWFKDWYFAEGFLESDVKLQGNKSINQESRRKEMLETRKEVTKFLEKEKREETFFQDARRKAEDVLNDIGRETSSS